MGRYLQMGVTNFLRKATSPLLLCWYAWVITVGGTATVGASLAVHRDAYCGGESAGDLCGLQPLLVVWAALALSPILLGLAVLLGVTQATPLKVSAVALVAVPVAVFAASFAMSDIDLRVAPFVGLLGLLSGWAATVVISAAELTGSGPAPSESMSTHLSTEGAEKQGKRSQGLRPDPAPAAASRSRAHPQGPLILALLLVGVAYVGLQLSVSGWVPSLVFAAAVLAVVGLTRGKIPWKASGSAAAPRRSVSHTTSVGPPPSIRGGPAESAHPRTPVVVVLLLMAVAFAASFAATFPGSE